ncbi:MAG: hypothetical protein VKP72_06485 [bacterium]|nr:hypothetical protein [bacterium]
MDQFGGFNFDPFQTSYGFDVPQDLLQPAEPVFNVPPLGMVLLEQGILTEDQMSEVLKTQLEQQLPLVQILLEGGFANQEQVLQALRVRPQYG